MKPSSEQLQKIERTMGVCRYVYNLFIATNLDNYRKGTHEYMSGYDFSKWLNNDYRKSNSDKLWIWEVSSKSVKKAIMNADKAYKDFMKGRKGFPNFKKRNGLPVGMYLPRNNQGDLTVERHRAKIPTLGWVRIKECGYVPRKAKAISVTIRKRAGRYFASFVFETNAVPVSSTKTAGIGIDLGVKSFAVISDGRNYPNINKTEQVHKARRRLKREQRKFSRKTKQRKEGAASKKCKRSNLDKQRLKVQRAYMKLSNQRHDYINKTVHEIVITRPEYITIEDLNVSGMLKNRHLSKAVASCEFWYFRALLERKCLEYGIELRIADRFYA
ncbi:MAG: transposase, partial [Synergistaceae bacterium]|nr:transposase [Synergistaceae bacterium]